MKADEIVSDVLDILRRKVPSLRVVASHVGPVTGDVEQMPLRLPAALVAFNDSEYDLVGLQTMEVKAALTVYVLTRPGLHGSGDAVGLSLIEEIAGALSAIRLNSEVEGFRPGSASLALRKANLLVHSLVLETVFENPVENALEGMEVIRTAHLNILESSSVSLVQGTEDSFAPLYRLYDRNLSRPFKSTTAETLEVLVDQGAGTTIASVDTLIIPEGHNLEGVTLGLKRSDDGINFTDVLEDWIASSEAIYKTWTSVEGRFWKLIINTPFLIPSVQEIFLTRAYEWERMPLPASSLSAETHNILKRSSSDGRQRFLKSGPARRSRKYNIPRCNLVMKDEMLALWDTCGEGKPFWLCDHNGEWMLGGLQDSPGLNETSSGSYALSFDFMEVLS